MTWFAALHSAAAFVRSMPCSNDRFYYKIAETDRKKEQNEHAVERANAADTKNPNINDELIQYYVNVCVSAICVVHLEPRNDKRISSYMFGRLEDLERNTEQMSMRCSVIFRTKREKNK